MKRSLCHARISRARITAVNVNADDCITIDATLLATAGVETYEQVLLINHDNGSRLKTFVIPGQADSGHICLNGPTSALGDVGDIISIIAYAEFGPEEARGYQPQIITVDNTNHQVSD